ncbi:hypothetical protein [Streptomyces sp. NPDC001833]|uniref:hypothetical protein n=1 Tax=Streptomyces sp. NPDC001833 TaxID=3154658 RepID=UPI0033212AEE
MHIHPHGEVRLSSRHTTRHTLAAQTARGPSHGSLTTAADSPDLHQWQPIGLAVSHRPHEGPNVFELGGRRRTIVDEWRGQGVLRSDGLTTWEHQSLILDKPGGRSDGGITTGRYADAVVRGVGLHLLLPHVGRGRDAFHAIRRSSPQVATVRVVDDALARRPERPVRIICPPSPISGFQSTT